MKKVLVGNKCDKEERQVSTEQGQKLADEKGIKFFETSAKTNENVKEMFEYLTNEIFRNYEEKEESINIKKAKEEHHKCCK